MLQNVTICVTFSHFCCLEVNYYISKFCSVAIVFSLHLDRIPYFTDQVHGSHPLGHHQRGPQDAAGRELAQLARRRREEAPQALALAVTIAVRLTGGGGRGYGIIQTAFFGVIFQKSTGNFVNN